MNAGLFNATQLTIHASSLTHVHSFHLRAGVFMIGGYQFYNFAAVCSEDFDLQI